MKRSEKRMVEKNLDLIFEFEKYVLQHPDFAASIPQNAVVYMQVEKDKGFNRWSLALMERHHEKGQPIFCVRIKKMRPIQSRIEELKVERAA